VCWKPCSSCWSFHLLREEFLLAPIHSPLSGSSYRSFSLRGHDQAQRCTRQLSMIPTTKSEPKHLRTEGTSCARKSNENSSKETRKSNELQEGNRHNHESFHSLGGQILYKWRKNLNLWSKEMRSSPDGWFAWKP
jgi:hypothetical protein